MKNLSIHIYPSTHMSTSSNSVTIWSLVWAGWLQGQLQAAHTPVAKRLTPKSFTSPGNTELLSASHLSIELGATEVNNMFRIQTIKSGPHLILVVDISIVGPINATCVCTLSPWPISCMSLDLESNINHNWPIEDSSSSLDWSWHFVWKKQFEVPWFLLSYKTFPSPCKGLLLNVFSTIYKLIMKVLLCHCTNNCSFYTHYTDPMAYIQTVWRNVWILLLSWIIYPSTGCESIRRPCDPGNGIT